MNKSILLLHGFLFVILILIQSTDANWIKSCFGGCFPKEDEYDRPQSPVKQRPNVEYVPPPKPVPKIKKTDPVVAKPEPVIVTPSKGNKPSRQSSIKKTENSSPPKSRKSPTTSNGSTSGEHSPTGKSKSTLKKNILADLEVQIASEGKLARTVQQAKTFKAAVEERCKGKGVSDTFVLTGESCAKGMGNLYKK